MRRVLWVLLAMGMGVGVAVAAPNNPWPGLETPLVGPARAIGGYSAGCLAGAQKLALDGPGYQVMRPSRRRNFGHPALVDFITALGGKVQRELSSVLLVGDLSQPRGGRAARGHSSHQTGLDVDLWYWVPPRALKAPLSTRQRERIAARTVVDEEAGSMLPRHRKHVAHLLRLSAQDPRVVRIFVNPIIKRQLCGEVKAERGFLHKLRPWYGHDDHFHVRLACPSESPDCEPQAAVDEGDGCDELGFWFDEEAQKKRKQAQKKYQRNVRKGQGWPEACGPLLTP